MDISICNWPRTLAKGPQRNPSKKASSEPTAWTASTVPTSSNPSSVATSYSHGWPVSTSSPNLKTAALSKNSPSTSKRSSETSGLKTPTLSVSYTQVHQRWKLTSRPLVSVRGRGVWRMGIMGLRGSFWGTFMITGIKYFFCDNLGFYWF